MQIRMSEHRMYCALAAFSSCDEQDRKALLARMNNGETAEVLKQLSLDWKEPCP